MANNNDTSKPDIMLESESTELNEKNVTSGSHINHYIISGLSFIIAITAIFIAIYTVQLHKHLNQQMLNVNGALTQQLEKLKSNQSSSQSEVVSKGEQLKQMQNDLQNKLTNIQNQLQTSKAQQSFQNEDWLLLKARYYLELAQMDCFWSHDLKSTATLLESADNILKDLNKPEILSIRQTIASELTQIKSVPDLDISGLFAQLQALQSDVYKLNTDVPVGASQPQFKTLDANSSWKARIQKSFDLFGQLVVVRRDNEKVKPLLSPLYMSLVREAISMSIQEAQWAVLNNNQSVYEIALKQAIDNLNRSFDSKESNTSSLINQLNELGKRNLNQNIPQVNKALNQLNEYIDSKPNSSNKPDPEKEA